MPDKRRPSFEDNVILRLAVGAVLLGMVVAAVPLARALTDSSPDEPFTAVMTAPPGGAEVSGGVALSAESTHAASKGTFMVSGPGGTIGINGVADESRRVWRGTWNAGPMPAGDYTLAFSSVRAADGITASSQPVQVRLRASDGTQGTTSTTTAGTADPNAATTDSGNAMTGTITEPTHMSTVSGGVGLSVVTSEEAGAVEFVITPSNGGGTAVVAGSRSSGTVWTGIWQSATSANGVYSIAARITKDAFLTHAGPVTVTLSNAFTTPTFSASLNSPGAGATLSGIVLLNAGTNQAASSLVFSVHDSSGTVIATLQGEGSGDGTQWRSNWDSTMSANGTYGVSVRAVREGALAEVSSRSFTVNNVAPVVAVNVGVLSPAPGAALTDPVQLRVQTSTEISSLVFYITQNFGSRLTVQVPASGGGTGWSSVWESKGKERGPYLLTAKAQRETAAYESEPVNFTLVDAPQDPATVQAKVQVMQPTPGASFSGVVAVGARTDVAVDSLTFYLRTSVDAEPSASVSGTGGSGGTTWNGSLNVSNVTDGEYVIVATATKSGNRSSSAPVTVRVSSAAAPVAVKFDLAAPATNATVKGVVPLSAVSSVAVDGAIFVLEGAGIPNGKVAVSATGNASKTTWSGAWDSATARDGGIVIKAVAVRGSAETASAPRTVMVANGAAAETAPPPPPSNTNTNAPVAPVNAPPPPATQTDTSTTFTVLLERPAANESFSAEMPLAAKTSQTASAVRFVIGPSAGGTTAVVEGQYDAASLRWRAMWRAGGAPSGEYFVTPMAQTSGGLSAQGPRVRVLVSALTVAPAPTGTQPPPAGTQLPPPPVESVTVMPKADVIASVRQEPVGTTPLPTAPVTQQVAAARTQLNDECAKAGIPPERCSDWLARRQQNNPCVAAGILTKEECTAHLQRTGTVPSCVNVNDPVCASDVARTTAALVPAAELQELRETLIPRLGTNVTLPQRPVEGQPPQGQQPPGGNVGEAPRALADSIPLVSPEGSGGLVLRLHASPGFEEGADGSTHLTVPGIILLDADADGLPDDMEKRIGTDPFNADTDADGYPDAIEIERGYNPLGPGKLTDGVRLAPVDVAIVSGAPIEQPRDAGAASPDLTVDAAASDAADEGSGIELSGTAAPGSVVTVFVYSYLPVVFTTTTDENGNWSYEMDADLTDGSHEAYVTVTDDTGKIQAKSNPLSFFVEDARAVSEEEFFDPTLQSPLIAAAEQPEQTLLGIYVGAAALAVLLALVAAYFIVARRSRVPSVAGGGGFTPPPTPPAQ